jgi:hypothetical protein
MTNIVDSGFISINRKILEWEWYSDNNVKSLFIHCLLKANFKEKSWQGQTIKRGMFITSYGNLSNELNLSVKQIRTAFSKLIKTNEIITKGTNKNTLVTIVKYNDYQTQGQPKGKPKATKGQSKDKPRATTNNDNKDNKEIIHRAFDHLSITKEQFEKLCIEYEPKVVNGILDNIENFGSNKKYKSLYLTAKNWLKKEPKRKTIELAEKQVKKTFSAREFFKQQNIEL